MVMVTLTNEQTEAVMARIAELEKEQQSFLESANRQLAVYDGAIAELKRLIESKQALPAQNQRQRKGEKGGKQ